MGHARMGATEHSEKVESYFAGWEESPNYLDDVEMRRLLRSILGLATTAEGKSLARPHRIGSLWTVFGACAAAGKEGWHQCRQIIPRLYRSVPARVGIRELYCVTVSPAGYRPSARTRSVSTQNLLSPV